MNAHRLPDTWTLSVTNRCVRGVISIAALLAATSIPSLSEVWTFALAIVGLYAGQTALLNVGLCYAFVSPHEEETSSEGGIDSESQEEHEVEKETFLEAA